MSAPELTRYFPKAGRTPPARLQLVHSTTANPFDAEEKTACMRPSGRTTWKDILRARGELPRPKASKAHVEPWRKPGYTYPEPLTGSQKHARDVKSAQEGLARIRPCPTSLAALLATPEWRGSTIGAPSPAEVERMRTLCAAGVREAEDLRSRARCAAQKAKLGELVAARARRLDRVAEAVRVSHPSGATMLWLPTE